jgi:5-methylcytosine-specific restriction endonuclease McrA
MWKVEWSGRVMNVPEKGPLPSEFYGKRARGRGKRDAERQAKTREQLPLYQAVLDSYATTGGFRGYRYSTPEEAAKHRKLYLKAYQVIWRWTKLREKDKRVKDKRPMSGLGVAAFYREVATAESIICFYCLRDVPPVDRVVDHYIPLARGGSHSRENLVAACSDCNQRKSAQMPGEFISGLKIGS